MEADDEQLITEAIAGRNAGCARDWTGRLERRIERSPGNSRLWHTLGTLWRAELESEQAVAAFIKARTLDPSSAVTAHALARATLEAGWPATERYDEALAISPGDGSILLGKAAAQVAQGQIDDALSGLEALLHRSPQWAEGQRQLVELRIAKGIFANPFTMLDEAIEEHPFNANLRAVKLEILYKSQEFERLAHFATSCKQVLGTSEWLVTYQAIAASELGELTAADALFDRLLPTRSPELASHAMRHAVRAGRPDAAAAIGEPLIDVAGSNHVWPWLGAAWRMVDDPRAQWLYDQPHLVHLCDLLGSEQTETLANSLRRLHRTSSACLGQSVRDGTQTDGPLLARAEPEIVALRKAILTQVESHIVALPHVEGHPTLTRKPTQAQIAGSWSVRFHGRGYHANHVHPLGWMSAALYITVPLPWSGDPQAGWLVLGQPPEEVGATLDPIAFAEPRPGRLVLFPSIMWHGTRPFSSGERMTVAFDIALPA
ncbi:2OG-Fe(II) oxygenase family protein [Pelagerythrobacter rhizovicinus]|uniref:Tetratricopeptide repeat protein n=1 Tax=Pelagerythrobacter rhizovicinus TaxID=2268576 RepID=A0A4Q2KGB5_9SPHN|nr:putative 2OG-Fe(II) oxygenase [Pelagerythrobacter rhizovicinus]RXZ64094.1 tetratricopeptide repeat protein [Pelagerythrobacter rhizovicinus]